MDIQEIALGWSGGTGTVIGYRCPCGYQRKELSDVRRHAYQKSCSHYNRDLEKERRDAQRQAEQAERRRIEANRRAEDTKVKSRLAHIMDYFSAFGAKDGHQGIKNDPPRTVHPHLLRTVDTYWLWLLAMGFGLYLYIFSAYFFLNALVFSVNMLNDASDRLNQTAVLPTFQSDGGIFKLTIMTNFLHLLLTLVGNNFSYGWVLPAYGGMFLEAIHSSWNWNRLLKARRKKHGEYRLNLGPALLETILIEIIPVGILSVLLADYSMDIWDFLGLLGLGGLFILFRERKISCVPTAKRNLLNQTVVSREAYEVSEILEERLPVIIPLLSIIGLVFFGKRR